MSILNIKARYTKSSFFVTNTCTMLCNVIINVCFVTLTFVLIDMRRQNAFGSENRKDGIGEFILAIFKKFSYTIKEEKVHYIHTDIKCENIV